MANTTVNKVVLGGETLIDLTSDTVTDASHIMIGYIGHLRDGSQVTGTGQGGGDPQTIYCGASAPSNSLGKNGDLYMVMSSGSTAEKYAEDFTAQNVNSTSGLNACIGVSAEDGTSTSNVYSSGQSTTGIVNYTFDFSDIPSNATITDIGLVCKAHEENSSRSTCTIQLYSGSTAKGSMTTVNGKSNTLYTINCGSWTRAELDNLTMRLSLGYYGGLIAGATMTISYQTELQWQASLTGNSSSMTMKGTNMYQKSNGSWSQVSSVVLEDLIARG